jgi:hypothetical protein
VGLLDGDVWGTLPTGVLLLLAGEEDGDGVAASAL